MATYHFSTPLQEEDMRKLHVGDVVYLTGHVFTARDMAHLRIRGLLEEGKPLPKDFAGAAVFHAGPVALKNEDGSWRLNVIGPTTSIRMEPYADVVGRMGVRAVIGKGGMDADTLRACGQYGYVYLQAAPGCAAKLAQGIERINDVTWFELGMPEAVWDLQANEFGPLVVGMDTHGQSIYKNLKEAALHKIDEAYLWAGRRPRPADGQLRREVHRHRRRGRQRGRHRVRRQQADPQLSSYARPGGDDRALP